MKGVYLAFVVAIKTALDVHLDIQWGDRHEREIELLYLQSRIYSYEFISEELDHSITYQRNVYSCHMKGIEINKGEDPVVNSALTKEAYIKVKSEISTAGGWVIVSIGDIDAYNRILVNIFSPITKKSLNCTLLETVSSFNIPVVRKYNSKSKNSLYKPKSNAVQ